MTTQIIILPCGKEITSELYTQKYYKIKDSCKVCRLKDLCGLFNDFKYKID